MKRQREVPPIKAGQVMLNDVSIDEIANQTLTSHLESTLNFDHFVSSPPRAEEKKNETQPANNSCMNLPFSALVHQEPNSYSTKFCSFGSSRRYASIR